MKIIADQIVDTVESSTQWLRQLDEEATRHRPTPDRWTLLEVMGHLIDSAANNHQRFIRAQESRELVFPKYDQNSWVEKNDYGNADWTEIVDLWRLYNNQLARVIARIPADQLSTACTIEPYEPCTLEFLITDYLSHLKHHLRKIEERIG